MDDKGFNADEVLLMAQQIERNGARFYRRAAEGFGKGNSKELLLQLAQYEDKHEKVFGAMRDDLGQTDEFNPDQQATMYLNAMADGHIFDPHADPCEKLNGSETIEEVLKAAIEIEKNSILFYLGAKEIVSETLGKDRIDWIIREEMSHLAYLGRHLVKLRGELQ